MGKLKKGDVVVILHHHIDKERLLEAMRKSSFAVTDYWIGAIEKGDFDAQPEPIMPDKNSEAYKIIYADGFVAGQNSKAKPERIEYTGPLTALDLDEMRKNGQERVNMCPPSCADVSENCFAGICGKKSRPSGERK